MKRISDETVERIWKALKRDGIHHSKDMVRDALEKCFGALTPKADQMPKDNIVIDGYMGTWYVISETDWQGKQVYLLEHETYGDEAANLIVDKNLKVIMDDVWNGFNDLYELED